MLTAIFAKIAEHWLVSWLKGPLVEFWGLFRHHPATVLLCLSIAANAWLYRSLAHEKAAHHSDIVAIWATIDQNRADTAALRAVEQAAANQEADNAQADYEDALGAANAATDRAIADAERLRAEPPSVRPAITIGQADPAGLRTQVPPDPALADQSALMRGFAACSVYAVELRDAFLVAAGLKSAPKPKPAPFPTPSH